MKSYMNVRTIRLMLVFVMAYALLGTGCMKHGEDDPFISFIPRDDRLKGDWKLELYNMDENLNREQTISFNLASCDTALIAGVTQYKEIVQESFSDSTLLSIYNLTESNIGTTYSFDIEFSYSLEILKSGVYRVRGSYGYYNDIIGADVEGDFESETNAWYWEEDGQEKSAIRFTNFPIPDPRSIQENGLPMSYQPEITFHVKRLANKELVLTRHAADESSVQQFYAPFSIEDIDNCVQSEQVSESYVLATEWRFSLIEGTE